MIERGLAGRGYVFWDRHQRKPLTFRVTPVASWYFGVNNRRRKGRIIIFRKAQPFANALPSLVATILLVRWHDPSRIPAVAGTAVSSP
jgi:hypothetical protein